MLPVAAVAQIDAFCGDARTGALGGCYVPMADSTVTVDVGWRQAFMLKGMATRTLAVVAPLGRQGRAGLHYAGFGDEDYSEQQAAAGYGVRVAPWLTVMAYGLYSRVATADAHYDAQQWVDAGCGVTLGGEKLWGYLTAGSRRWSDGRPWGMRGGVAYRPTEQMLNALGFSFEERLRLRCGMEYTYGGCAAVRAGLITNPLTLTFGAGYRQQRFHIDLATEVHSTLGLSPQISLGLCF